MVSTSVIAAVLWAALAAGDAKLEGSPEQPSDAALEPAADVADEAPPTELTAADVGAAPSPTQAHGVEEGDRRDRKPALWVPRVLLFPGRAAVFVVALPVRGAAYLYDRYQLPQRVGTVLLMENEQAGVVPVASIQTGLGGRVGARFFHHDLFDRGVRVSTRASFGRGQARLFRTRLRSGNLLGRGVQLQAVVQFQQRRNLRFFGIGNGDEVSNRTFREPRLDALTDDTAIPTRLTSDSQQYELGLTWRVDERVSLGLASSIDHVAFSQERSARFAREDVTRFYDPESLIGFSRGLLANTTRTELVISTLRTTNPWINRFTPSKGWFARADLAYTKGIVARDRSDFLRWAADVQRLFDVYRGDRVIVLRARAEGVTGPLDRLPITKLPELGGPVHLRGYPRFRFRDRFTAYGTIEYRYPIGEAASGYLFFDAGRVYRSPRDFELRKWRAGGGPGLILHTRGFLIARIFVAASVDGGFTFQLSLDPLTS